MKEISRRLQGSIRREELLARHGGEEFCIVLPETGLAEARTFAERARRLISDEPFQYEGDIFSVIISIGVATTDDDGDVNALIKNADENLYRAKREGRDRIVSDINQRTPWKADPGFKARVSQGTAVIAISLIGRDILLSREGGAARVDDLEGLLFTHLQERAREERLLFDALDGTGKLLVALSCKESERRLRILIAEALRKFAEETSEEDQCSISRTAESLRLSDWPIRVRVRGWCRCCMKA